MQTLLKLLEESLGYSGQQIAEKTQINLETLTHRWCIGTGTSYAFTNNIIPR